MYKEYLPYLGIKKIQLQGGWAKTEKQKGIYDFPWLDHIIDDALARGLNPWLEASYGNPLYNNGDKEIGNSISQTEETLVARDHWVEAIVSRYKDKVTEWEIWNEPDGTTKEKAFNTTEHITEFNIRTAEMYGLMALSPTMDSILRL
jgi:GH35 family endo-1,4-beta-xylanase